MNALRLAHHDLRGPRTPAWARQLEGVDFLLLDAGPLSGGDAPAEQLPRTLRTLGPQLYMDAQLRLVASLAGGDPSIAGPHAAQTLVDTGNPDLPLAVVRGQDVLDRLEELLLHTDLAHAETGQRFVELSAKTVGAIASLGPRAVSQAVKQGARAVLTAHETPAVLCEAVARAATGKRDLPTARKLGQTLADCSPQAVSDTLRRPEWSPEQSLQAELTADLDVEFFGGAELTDSARRRFAETSSAVDPDQSNLTLTYLDGYQARLVLWASEAAARGRLEEVLTNAPPELRPCICPPSAAADGALVEVTLHHANRAKVENAAAELAGVLEVASGVLGLRRIGGPPLVEPRYRQWPTVLPVELLEWSIDIKPAQQWVD
ncbi:hypothetical protein KOR34_27190 [Posidoniimonas corsicana]|uniref:Acyclic terpene utilisation N-terminal domain-containing protein n=1 Tax=Posidoniimonas corsicana TaxID=1938618 RepID=A0A5C5VGP4_9BACT|nr:acyclic terpene utilization AtuA family protein [Posidoniimonas corsicana]TWT37756.1 hypothetical protein KOR34_27190 [Posidoniimonas corsicana]